MNKRKLSSESDDSDLVKLCSFLLPEVQRIVNDRRVSEKSPITPLLEDILRHDGIIPVLREFSKAIQYPSTRKAHSSEVPNTECSRALVSTFNKGIQKDGKIVRDCLRTKPANNSSHYPAIQAASSLPSKYIGFAVIPPPTPINYVLNTSKKPVPSTLEISQMPPLKDRRIYFLKRHETSDVPYLAQTEFPEFITVGEEKFFQMCPFAGFAFDVKRIGMFSDLDDKAIYDPESTRNKKRCIGKAKIVYLANLIDSTYFHEIRGSQSPYAIRILCGWSIEKIWRNTRTWVLFVDGKSFEERISSEAELDEVCMLGSFLGANTEGTALLRKRYRNHRLKEYHSDSTKTGNSLVNKRALESGISSVDEAHSKRLRGNDYVADEAQNVTSDLGWRHRDD
ncbi:uncharacterized protein EAF02_003470 [Botrytis sinoallii]|uniref:uncharacterized protein n=1 Tax=Botrytis sinoallii TaxID=1463999 RepID=UPI001900AC18|nr:uncharacterized protein EAF02_003470 [Botrytis sinoallii]KAF7886823.1 hypothetical protein EAF02_003470 [Botrytis sinoallii]